jgi:hypothetical protein
MPVKRRSGPPGCAGGDAARRRGERARGGGAERGGWWAARGFRTWAERPNAGPHVGEKKKHEPSFSGKKNKEPEIPCVFSHLGPEAAILATVCPLGPASEARRLYYPVDMRPRSVGHSGLLRRPASSKVLRDHTARTHAATAVLSDCLRFCMCGLVLCGSSAGQSRRKNGLYHPGREPRGCLHAGGEKRGHLAAPGRQVTGERPAQTPGAQYFIA